MVALSYAGKPLSRDHGGQRLLVPPLLLKSAKWVMRCNSRRVTRPAFGSCGGAITSTAIRGAEQRTPMTENRSAKSVRNHA